MYTNSRSPSIQFTMEKIKHKIAHNQNDLIVVHDQNKLSSARYLHKPHQVAFQQIHTKFFSTFNACHVRRLGTLSYSIDSWGNTFVILFLKNFWLFSIVCISSSYMIRVRITGEIAHCLNIKCTTQRVVVVAWCLNRNAKTLTSRVDGHIRQVATLQWQHH